jgi:hypothetical protein
MGRIRLRFTVRRMLLAVAVIAVVVAGLVGYLDYQEKTRRYQATLAEFGMVGGRTNFSTVDAYRGFLEECRHAEEYLRIQPRHFAKGADLWTDEDERRWRGRFRKPDA